MDERKNSENSEESQEDKQINKLKSSYYFENQFDDVLDFSYQSPKQYHDIEEIGPPLGEMHTGFMEIFSPKYSYF